jgi:hypothetical protein
VALGPGGPHAQQIDPRRQRRVDRERVREPRSERRVVLRGLLPELHLGVRRDPQPFDLEQRQEREGRPPRARLGARAPDRSVDRPEDVERHVNDAALRSRDEPAIEPQRHRAVPPDERQPLVLERRPIRRRHDAAPRLEDLPRRQQVQAPLDHEVDVHPPVLLRSRQAPRVGAPREPHALDRRQPDPRVQPRAIHERPPEALRIERAAKKRHTAS